MRKVEKYIEDEKVYVLLGNGYGWSSRCSDTPEIAYDKKVIEFYLNHRHIGRNDIEMVRDYFKSIGYSYVPILSYLEGDLHLEYVDKGTKFYITRENSREKIIKCDDIKWLEA